MTTCSSIRGEAANHFRLSSVRNSRPNSQMEQTNTGFSNDENRVLNDETGVLNDETVVLNDEKMGPNFTYNAKLNYKVYDGWTGSGAFFQALIINYS